jgi:hypothetical protein
MRGGVMMETVSAEPIGEAADRVWLIECSVHGPLGVVVDGLEELLCRDHLAFHGASQ